MVPGNNDTEPGAIEEAGFAAEGEGNGMDENGLPILVDVGLMAYDVSRDVRAEEALTLGGYICRVCGTLEEVEG